MLIDAFGAPRLMWGSDWPVLQQGYDATTDAMPYGSWLKTAAHLVDELASDDRDWIFGKTASLFYGIDQSTRSS